MSRYTPEELRGMAEHALRARDAGDPRWTFLCVSLALAFTCRFDEVEARIVALARAPAQPTAHDYVPPHVWVA